MHTLTLAKNVGKKVLGLVLIPMILIFYLHKFLTLGNYRSIAGLAGHFFSPYIAVYIGFPTTLLEHASSFNAWVVGLVVYIFVWFGSLYREGSGATKSYKSCVQVSSFGLGVRVSLLAPLDCIPKLLPQA